MARVCSAYLQSCDRGAATKSISPDHRAAAGYYLNDLCGYCGALPVGSLPKTHIRTWVDAHTRGMSPATEWSVPTIVTAAFNDCQDNHSIPNPLKVLKKPAPKPRPHSLPEGDEDALVGAADTAPGARCSRPNTPGCGRSVNWSG